ncbi:hypothetical protein [uncultured Sphingomonas sp.]|uniref:hypothetical protein n=1 Tax=uncultured Sphingomonas sp. TaxID=158754 RepID=UPI00259330AF|nr:hypothetical protein [uncultured Sphingomonas sp.]
MALALLAMAVFLGVAIALQHAFGIPIYTSYRVACGGFCLAFMARIGDVRYERWARIAVAVAAVISIGLFFTPAFDRPASRGEVLFFALPDIAVFFMARAMSYPDADEHQRAVRQQLFVGFAFALALCVLMFATAFIPNHHPRVEATRAGG